jgi:uncharacterized protein CbrC (UPF0167 family)
MERESLPRFLYHPDPVASGSIEPSDTVCAACERVRGFIYSIAYLSPDFEGAVCPWCISDGSAHIKYGIEFVDPDAIGGRGRWGEASPVAIAEVAYRTPAFAAWQDEMWFTHCGDAAQFLNVVGWKELEPYGADAIAAIAEEASDMADDANEYVRDLDREHGPTAYLFRCRHCGAFGGFSDIH